MKNILLIAKREFVAAVTSRAYIIGLLIVPALIAVFVLIGPRLAGSFNSQIRGQIAVLDPTGRVLPQLRKALDPARAAERRREDLAGAPQQLRRFAANAPVLGPVPDIRVLDLPLGADIEQEKQWLLAQPKEMPHLALVVLAADAVVPGAGGKYGSYDLYVPSNADDRALGEVQRGLREGIVHARLEARALDGAVIEALVSVPPVQSVTVTRTDQSKTVQGFNILLPAAFGALLLVGALGGGGQLLSSTVEEKSSRVVEVLLSAVSPVEFMAGKLIGQMAVSLLGMAIYLALGLGMLSVFALLGLLDFSLILYLVIFFVITYAVMGSLMMSVGAAVDDIKEAQGLMMPLTIVFMIPWILWVPISRDPGSPLSVAMSFIPPVNTFAMLLRIASTMPPPLWQVWVSIGIGALSAAGAVWFAAKVFRIGLLMHGKTPNIATLIAWVRAA